MAPADNSSRSRWLRRNGPAVILVVVVLVATAIAVTNRGNNRTTATAAGGAVGAAATSVPTAASTPVGVEPAGVIPWSQAKAQGRTASIDWGARCDTSTGRLKYPSFFAGECYAPFAGDNGGSTYQGVTADSIKIVLYLPQEHDPVLSFAYGAIGATDTNAQTAQTVQDFVTFFQTYYETYGRKVDLVPYSATGTILDEVAARADAVHIAEAVKPRAGVRPAAVLSYTSPLGLLNDAPSLIARLKVSGVTSIVFSGAPLAPGALAGAAVTQNYCPEWIVSGTAFSDTNVFGRTYDQRE